MDCTTMGWFPPTVTAPTLTAAERRRGLAPTCVDIPPPVRSLDFYCKLQKPSRMESSRSDVRSHSRELKKELGLWNLVFTQILFVMGLSWVGTAAKLGSSHVVFWLLGVVLFYIPSAIVVV